MCLYSCEYDEKRGGVEAIASSYVIVEADKSEYGRTAIINRAEILWNEIPFCFKQYTNDAPNFLPRCRFLLTKMKYLWRSVNDWQFKRIHNGLMIKGCCCGWRALEKWLPWGVKTAGASAKLEIWIYISRYVKKGSKLWLSQINGIKKKNKLNIRGKMLMAWWKVWNMSKYLTEWIHTFHTVCIRPCCCGLGLHCI